MNIIWPYLIIISYIFAMITGNIEEINKSIYNSSSEVIQLTLVLLGNMCLWCGLMNIVKNTKIIKYVRKIFNPILMWLFPEEKNETKIMNEISINTISNMLGIGNAATLSGLKAMELLYKKNSNKKEISNSISTLVIMNTTSIQLIPTTAIAVRASLNSQNPTEILIPIWISTFAGTVTAIIINRFIISLRKKKVVE